jgi:NAD(P)-dependent dehydrogenase (short-subunit alcohol dehydrogenase family)
MTPVVIITGASRGIGAATAQLAAQRGYAVCVNYRTNRRAADQVVKAIEAIEASGARAIAVGADVSIETDVVRLFETCDRTLGSVTALVNNAGVLETQMRVEHMDAARLNRVVDYAASKGAIDTLTIGLAAEVAAEGIRVNAVRAGYIYTEMHASGGEPNRVDRLKQFVPMRRGGTAAEVAHAVLWLLSDEASFTTGAFIDVTGGK